MRALLRNKGTGPLRVMICVCSKEGREGGTEAECSQNPLLGAAEEPLAVLSLESPGGFGHG